MINEQNEAIVIVSLSLSIVSSLLIALSSYFRDIVGSITFAILSVIFIVLAIKYSEEEEDE